MLRSKFSRHFQNAQADLSLRCGYRSLLLVLRHNEPPGNEPDNNNKGDPRFSCHFSKDKVNVKVQNFPPFFSAADVLENNRRPHFVKSHALYHHSEMTDRRLHHPTLPTGYEVI